VITKIVGPAANFGFEQIVVYWNYMSLCDKYEKFMREEINVNPDGYSKLTRILNYMNHTYHYWDRLNVMGCIGFRLWFETLHFTWWITGSLFRANSIL
jgi:endonuclease I